MSERFKRAKSEPRSGGGGSKNKRKKMERKIFVSSFSPRHFLHRH